MAFSRRYLIAKHWLFTNRNNVDFLDLLKNVLIPTAKYLARPKIEKNR
jgi:hypothetical protein